jgi:flagellar biogenesis protein FliO
MLPYLNAGPETLWDVDAIFFIFFKLIFLIYFILFLIYHAKNKIKNIILIYF